jgi:hypothetical protein
VKSSSEPRSINTLCSFPHLTQGFSFEDHHGHIRGNAYLSQFGTLNIPTRGSNQAEYFIENNSADESCGQTDSRRQLVEQHHLRQAMSLADLEAPEEFHNLLRGSMSMLLDLNDTNITLAKSSKSSKDPKAGKKSSKDPKASKKSKKKNPKPKAPKKPKKPNVSKTFVLKAS